MTYLSFLQSSSLGYRDKDDEIKKTMKETTMEKIMKCNYLKF